MLSQISLKNFRNLQEQSITLATGINLFLGENGSGKTSLLEAVFLLAMGRSFRSRSLKHAIQTSADAFLLFARTTDQIPVGLQHHIENGTQIRLNSLPLKRLSELTVHLPLQYIPANCHQYFEQGPRYRRQLLDWGVFHVKHDFNYHWQSYKKALMQRNAALKKKSLGSEVTLWDVYLCKHGSAITTYRYEYLQSLLEVFMPVFYELCPELKDAKFTLRYSQGWSKESELAEVLTHSFERDLALGYTRSGPHAADWTLRIDGADPYEMLSRGQQKLFYLAICIAQIKILKQQKDIQNTLLLIDDISSELDDRHQQTVITVLTDLPVQCLLTSTNMGLDRMLARDGDQVFHVKHGEIRQVLVDLSP